MRVSLKRYTNGWVEVAGCVFSNNVNRAKNASAGVMVTRGRARVVGCTFTGNVGADVAVGEKDSSAVVKGCRFDRPDAEALAKFAGEIRRE